MAIKLVKVTVDRYKSITHESTITLDPKVTALVGKNESGKTAVLEALYRVNPLPSGHRTAFDELRDYPRRYRARDKKSIDSTWPSVMYFELTTDELAELEDEFGAGILINDCVKVTRGYGPGSPIRWYKGQFDLAKMAAHRMTVDGLDADSFIENDLAATVRRVAEYGEAELSERLTADKLTADIHQFLAPRLPRFQYFDEYNVLPGSVSINRLQGTPEDQSDPGERTALSLLRLAGVETEEFSEHDYESRRASLEAAANQLTDEVLSTGHKTISYRSS